MHKTRNDTGLEAIRIEGGLLSSSLLNLLRHYQLPGQTPEDYGIEKGLKLSDELGRYWRIAQARWQQFSDLRKRNDLNHDTVAVENWLLPLFTRVLGFQVERVGPRAGQSQRDQRSGDDDRRADRIWDQVLETRPRRGVNS